MCGIVGIVNTGPDLRDESASILRMASRLRHRGPDDEGYLFVTPSGVRTFAGEDSPPDVKAATGTSVLYRENREAQDSLVSSIAFGHRRLSIIDLSLHGHQPMSYMDRYWIVFNGEIYNYIELRDELEEENYEFRTQSDTEVLLAAYHRWGTEAFSRFNGMWAFLLYDSHSDEVVICRDRFGIKPLSFWRVGDSVLFASEIKAFLGHPERSLEPNERYVRHFLDKYPTEYQGWTAFEDVYHFPPAHYFRGRPSELTKLDKRVVRYWSVGNSADSHSGDGSTGLNSFARKYKDLLGDAVRLRMRSDVSFGCALSGGLDSSSIAFEVNDAMRAENSSNQQLSFSTVYKTPKYAYCDESEYIDTMADALGIKSVQTEPSPEEVREVYRDIVYAMDTPQQSPRVDVFFTYRLVHRNGIKVTIDGQGADELQSGYLYYLPNFLTELPITRAIRESIALSKFSGASRWVRIGLMSRCVDMLGLSGIGERVLKWLGKTRSPFVRLSERLAADVEGNLINLLHYGDRASMAHSVEARYPFLDYRMVDFWLNGPSEMKVAEGWTKYAARVAFSGVLPDKIVWRRDKMGWEMPTEVWFREDLFEWASDTIRSSRYLKSLGLSEEIDQMIAEERKVDTTRLVKLLNLAIWHELFFEGHRDLKLSSVQIDGENT